MKTILTLVIAAVAMAFTFDGEVHYARVSSSMKTRAYSGTNYSALIYHTTVVSLSAKLIDLENGQPVIRRELPLLKTTLDSLPAKSQPFNATIPPGILNPESYLGCFISYDNRGSVIYRQDAHRLDKGLKEIEISL